MFVGAPNGEEEKVKERFLKEGISPGQLTVRIAKERKKFDEEFCHGDLVLALFGPGFPSAPPFME